VVENKQETIEELGQTAQLTFVSEDGIVLLTGADYFKRHKNGTY
jgi:hypothetical protein